MKSFIKTVYGNMSIYIIYWFNKLDMLINLKINEFVIK